MGGIYLRYALPFLVKKFKNIEFLNYISLASPHLGVSGNQTKYPPWLLNMTSTGNDLVCEKSNYSVSIVDLSCGEYLDALRQFKKRVAYAPIFNDGMVSFTSASISLSYVNGYKSEIMPMQSAMKIKINGEEKILNCSQNEIIIYEEEQGSTGGT